MKIPVLFLLCSFRILYAQDSVISSFDIPPYHFSTVDRAGDYYLLSTNGKIEKRNKNGELLHKTHYPEAPTVFDTGNGVRLLSYFRSTQRYQIHSPSLTLTGEYAIDPSFAIEPWLLCSSGDYNLWLLDRADWSLKKINAQQGTIIMEFLIDTTGWTKDPDFIYMKEYQNFLFLLDVQSGIRVFNNIGLPVKFVSAPGIRQFSFLGEEMYFIKEGLLHFYNLFTGETRTRNVDRKLSGISLTDERMFIATDTAVKIYHYDTLK